MIDMEKLDELFARGLCSGIGAPGGQVCIEAAIALACGEELNDAPACVHPAVQAHSITLNDALWSSPQARAAGLREYALAQLGTTEIDGIEFVNRLTLATVREILPLTLKEAWLEKEALACEATTTLQEAVEAAARAADAAARAAMRAAATAADAAAGARAARRMATAARVAADAAAGARVAIAAGARAARAMAAGAAADAAVDVAARAAADAAVMAARTGGNTPLIISATIATRILKDMTGAESGQ